MGRCGLFFFNALAARQIVLAQPVTAVMLKAGGCADDRPMPVITEEGLAWAEIGRRCDWPGQTTDWEVDDV